MCNTRQSMEKSNRKGSPMGLFKLGTMVVGMSDFLPVIMSMAMNNRSLLAMHMQMRMVIFSLNTIKRRPIDSIPTKCPIPQDKPIFHAFLLDSTANGTTAAR